MAMLRLGEQILDKGIVSKDGRRCGKVDDLILEWDRRTPSRGPAVTAIVSGPTALARQMPSPVVLVARVVYALLGVTPAKPVEVSWDLIESVGVVVRLTVERRSTQLNRVGEAVARRFIRRVPGA